MTAAMMRMSIVMMNNHFHSELKNGTLQRGRRWMDRQVYEWRILGRKGGRIAMSHDKDDMIDL